MSYVVLYLVVLVAFLALDLVWLKRVAAPMFRRHLGDMMLPEPRLGVAAAFYALYCVGVVYFAAAPALASGGALAALRDGAALGLVAYGAYEATNYATLKRWTAGMALLDVAWGAAVTGVAAAVAVALVG